MATIRDIAFGVMFSKLDLKPTDFAERARIAGARRDAEQVTIAKAEAKRLMRLDKIAMRRKPQNALKKYQHNLED